MKILITGISGRIGTVLARDLKQDHEIRGVATDPHWTMAGVDYLCGSITSKEMVESAVRGMDCVIHLAADPRPEAPWESTLRNNIDGMYLVVNAAVRAGVKKLIYASSNHITGGYTDTRTPMNVDMPVAPDSMYGVSKAFGEALGRYAYQYHGLAFIALRIGYFNEENHPYAPIPLSDVEPDLLAKMWISHRDLIQLVRKSVLAKDPVFAVFYGVSDNSGSLWDLSNARDILGYVPQDNSAHYTAYTSGDTHS